MYVILEKHPRQLFYSCYLNLLSIVYSSFSPTLQGKWIITRKRFEHWLTDDNISLPAIVTFFFVASTAIITECYYYSTHGDKNQPTAPIWWPPPVSACLLKAGSHYVVLTSLELFVAQAGLKLRHLPVSALWVLGLKLWSSVPSSAMKL